MWELFIGHGLLITYFDSDMVFVTEIVEEEVSNWSTNEYCDWTWFVCNLQNI